MHNSVKALKEFLAERDRSAEERSFPDRFGGAAAR
jgi:hypothetical protein